MSQRYPPGLGSSYNDYSPSEWKMFDEYFQAIMNEIGFQIDDVIADGNCFFRAVAATGFGNEKHYDEVRQLVCDEMMAERDLYGDFVDEVFENYIQRQRRDGTYAGNHEIQATCDRFSISIVVYSYAIEPMTFLPRFRPAVQDQIILSFHRGNHYNSVSSSPNQFTFDQTDDDIMDVPNSSGLNQKTATVKFQESPASNNAVDKITCPECAKVFKTKQTLREHLKLHDEPISCDLCGLELIPKHLPNHMKNMHSVENMVDEEIYIDPDCECSYCHRIFRSSKSLQSHVGKCPKKPQLSKSFPCSHCKKCFSSKSTLKRHTIEQHSEPQFKCKMCPKIFKRQELLDSHMKTHQETHEIVNIKTGKTETWRGGKQILTAGRKRLKDLGVSGEHHGKNWLSDVAYARGLELQKKRRQDQMSRLRASLQQQPQPQRVDLSLVAVKTSRKKAETVMVNGEKRKVIGISRRLVKPTTMLKSSAVAKSRMTLLKRTKVAERTKNYSKKQREDGPYPCTHCNKVFALKTRLNCHVNRYHVVDPELSHSDKQIVSPFHIMLSSRSPAIHQDLLENSKGVQEVVDHLNLYMNRLWKETMLKRYVYLVVLVKDSEGVVVTARNFVDEMGKRWNDPKFELEWYCGKSCKPGPSSYHTDMSTTDPIKSSIGSKLLTGKYKAFFVKQIVLSTKEEGIDEAELERHQLKMETFIQLIGLVQKLHKQKGMQINIINQQLESFPLWNIMTDEEKKSAIELGLTDNWNVFCFNPTCSVDGHKVHNCLFSGNLHIDFKQVKEVTLAKEIKNKDGSFECPHCNQTCSSQSQLYSHVLRRHSSSKRNCTEDIVASLFQIKTLRQNWYSLDDDYANSNFVDEILDKLNAICFELQASHTEKYCYLVALTKETEKLGKYEFLRKMKSSWKDPSSSLKYYVGKNTHPGPSSYHTDKKQSSNSGSTIAKHLLNGGQAFFVHQFVIAKDNVEIQENETLYDALTRDQEKLECFIQMYGFARRNVVEETHMQFEIANQIFEASSCKKYFSEGEKAQAIRLGGLEKVPVLCFCPHPKSQHDDFGYIFAGNIHVDVDNIYELKLHE